MRGLLLGAIAMAIGCKETVPIEVGGIDFDYGFLVTYGEQGKPIRISDAFGVEGGAVVFGAQPAFVLQDSEERFLFVAFDADQLPPSFDRGRAAQVEAILERPPDRLTLEGSGLVDLFARTSLPRDARLFTAELGEPLGPAEAREFELFEEVALRIPIEPEHCRIEGQTPLEPFASGDVPGALVGVMTVRHLDQDRALVGTIQTVYVIDRGAAYDSVFSGPYWAVQADPGWMPFDAIQDVAVGPEEPDGTRAVVAVGGVGMDGVEKSGAIWPLRLHPDGIRPDGDMERMPGPPIHAVTFTADGTAWVGATDGVLLTRAPGETSFRTEIQLAHRTDLADSFFSLRPISVGGRTMMAGMRNHLYLLGPNGWEFEYVMRGGIFGPEPIRFGDVAAVEDAAGPDFWAVGDRGSFARNRGDGWELSADAMKDLEYPPRFAPCASPGVPLLFGKVITAVEAFEGYVHMGHENCNALVVVRRSDRCVSLVTPTEEAVAFGASYITSIARFDRRLLIGTSAGVLYETVLP